MNHISEDGKHKSVKSKTGSRSTKHSSRSTHSNKSPEGGKSINILDFMPLHSKLAIDITLLALSLENYAKKNPKEDVFDKIKDNKTFKMFFKTLDHSFNGIDTKLFSYLFISIILCTSNNMDFSFKEFGFDHLDNDLQKYAKLVSTYVLEELSSGVQSSQNMRVPSRMSITKKNKPGKSNSRTLKERKIVVGGNMSRTYKRNLYRQSGGFMDMLIAFLMTIFTRFGPIRNRRFRRVTVPVMYMYFLYSIFSLYNNLRHIISPYGMFQEGDAAEQYSGLMETTATTLFSAIPTHERTLIGSRLGQIRNRFDRLPREVESFMNHQHFTPTVGQIVNMFIGFGFAEGVIEQMAPMVNRALTEFMMSDYYTVTVRHITDLATDIGRQSSASIARTQTAPIETTGFYGGLRRALSFLGFDIAGVDDRLGDALYNTMNAQQISADILNTVMRNSELAVERLTQDFTNLIRMETTRFRTRIGRHGWGIRYALGGIAISSYWLFLYIRFCRESRRRRKELGTVGSLMKKHNSRKDYDDDDNGNGYKRLGNGDRDDGNCASGGICSPRQLTM